MNSEDDGIEVLLRPVRVLARGMALLGGLVLSVLVALVCVSVIGRGLNSLGHAEWLETLAPGVASSILATGVGPVSGDFELIEAGIAFSIFAFLPICHLRASHAVVDVFTNPLPGWFNRYLIAFWELVLAVVIVVIGWRLFVGMLDKFDNAQTTFLLQFPLWWAYAASFAAASVAMLVGVYCALARVIGLITGREILTASGETDH